MNDQISPLVRFLIIHRPTVQQALEKEGRWEAFRVEIGKWSQKYVYGDQPLEAKGQALLQICEEFGLVRSPEFAAMRVSFHGAVRTRGGLCLGAEEDLVDQLKEVAKLYRGDLV